MVSTAHASVSFVELGSAVIGLAILARIANRWGFSAIPLYLLAGLAFGNGGLVPLNVSANFIHTGAEIGVLLLLFMLGLEYTGEQLTKTLRSGFPAGLADLVLNFPPGLAAGLLLGWKLLPAVLLGGVTYISSSGIIAKILGELQRLDFPETPTVISVLVIEDLAMAVYLPLVAVLITGEGPIRLAISISIAVATVCLVLFIAVRYGQSLSRFVAHESEEVVLLTTFGTVLLIGGIAERLLVSAAIGAFLVGIAVSGPLAEQSHRLLAPLRDLFAAMFFFFFGMQIDPASLTSVLGLAAALGIVTALTKVLTGYWAAQRGGMGKRERFRAGTVLVARGEFSIVIASLGAGLEPKLGPLAAAYVLFLAILGPICARAAK
ncbi:MAG TPA: cation:proton antiporter [Acidobacteriaceae bacterium]|nr:cation:proton antiporter [Acidobacteriaceae bacterium]